MQDESSPSKRTRQEEGEEEEQPPAKKQLTAEQACMATAFITPAQAKRVARQFAIHIVLQDLPFTTFALNPQHRGGGRGP